MSHSTKKISAGSITVSGSKGKGVKTWKRRYNKEIRQKSKDPNFVFTSPVKESSDSYGPRDGKTIYFTSKRDAEQHGMLEEYEKTLRK